MSSKLPIHIILTGGTIDSRWDPKQDTAVVSEHSTLPEYFDGLNLYEELTINEVCMKDSRALTPEDLKTILKAIEDSPSQRVLVTHGTYTMPDTARYLKVNLKLKDKVVILTGSMTPLRGFDFSDAGFNLGFAVAKLQDLKSGVYLAMNGKVFSADEAAKSITEGKFYSVFTDKQ